MPASVNGIDFVEPLNKLNSEIAVEILVCQEIFTKGRLLF